MAPAAHLINTYDRLPVSFTRGEGAWLWDNHGRRYLDAVAGIAVCGLGHCHPAVTAALSEQARTLVHTSNLYHVEWQEALSERLCTLADMDSAFFCNSGAEANEAAIKLARLYGKRRQIRAPSIVVTEGSFHGRTLATLSATGSRKVQAGFEPLVQGFRRVPYDDLEALKLVSENTTDIVAVLVEPILGEGGIVLPRVGYLRGLRELCDTQGWLLMLDEIQTGLCRTGRWFAHQHYDVRPDVMTLAKSLGNGVPIGACLARGLAAEVFQPGTHGSTFGGNPLACHVGLAVLETMESAKLAKRAAELGKRMLETLAHELSEHPGVAQVRGQGLMLGIELERPCRELVTVALDKGVLINVTAERVVRLLPPLVINDRDADHIVKTTVGIVREFGGG
ncbi:MAG: aspartate aminotransferase family protein [Acidiferrobacterales bacterium]